MKEIITRAIQDGSLRKIVLSRPVDKQIRKCTASPVQKDGALLVQLETLCADGKALHRNLSAQEAPDALCALFTEGYRQADILTSGGSCTVMRAKSGACHIKNGIRADAAPLPADLPPLEGKKAHILDDPSALPFLHALGLADEKGRILDRKRPKYRQINRFLELLRDVEDYDVATMELVDPEETPKNVLLRCVKRDVPLSGAQKKRLRERYDAACALLSANPCLDRLLTSGAVGAADVPLPLR